MMGYERAAYYDLDEDAVSTEPAYRIFYTNTLMKPHWFTNVRDEYRACREAVALVDYSCTFTKLDLTSSGGEVVDFLQRVCSNDVDIPVGGIIHTGMHNEQGGYENDCSLARYRLRLGRLFGLQPSFIGSVTGLHLHI